MAPSQIRAIAIRSIIAGTFSLVVTGHVSGISNNLFNYITLGRLYNLRQFGGDTPVQSMRYYASGFWMPFAGVGNWLAPDFFFLAWAWIARVAVVGTLLLWADLVGCRKAASQIAFLTIILLSRYMIGFAYAGDGDLLTNTFSHSDLANATMLLALYWAARSRFGLGCIATGATFLINAFMAIWTAVPFGMLLVHSVVSNKIGAARAAKRVAIGMVGFVLLAIPVFWATWSNPEARGQTGFSYGPFLLAYFPGHFLVNGIDRDQVLSLWELCAAGVVAAWSIRDRSPAPLIALSGFALIWLVGAPLPFLLNEPGVYILHLLRSSVGIHFFAMISIAAMTVGFLERHSASSKLVATAVFASCVLPSQGPLLLLIATVSTLTIDWWPERRVFQAIALALALATGAKAIALTAHRWKVNRKTEDRKTDWEKAAHGHVLIRRSWPLS